jgi:hypothetical protein
MKLVHFSKNIICLLVLDFNYWILCIHVPTVLLLLVMLIIWYIIILFYIKLRDQLRKSIL